MADRSNKKESIFGFSKCDSCKKRIRMIALLPVFGWIICRGKCLYCKNNINYFYPLIEFAYGILAVFQSDRMIFLLAAAMILFLSREDVFDQSSHSALLYPFILYAYTIDFSLEKTIGIISLLLVFIFFIIKKAIGPGDLPVIICLFTLLDPVQFSISVMIASMSALLFIILKKRKKIPFIPFLNLGFLAVIFI
ncbi:prepilin peptidase [Oenococcus alcoholitolerans]|uniref:prepilin peptidase n=1 Tax=Oenococcus alcoholitolerans TaxID=931074 RepID=UPI003F714390